MSATPPSPATSAPVRGGWKSLAVILLIVLGGQQAWSWWRDERSATLIQQHASQADITLYTTSTCPYCARARAWLDAHGIAWRECNVETDADCMARYEAQGAPGVPLVHAAGRWHLGFDPVWLGQILAASAAEPPASTASAAIAVSKPAAQSNPSRASSPRP